MCICYTGSESIEYKNFSVHVNLNIVQTVYRFICCIFCRFKNLSAPIQLVLIKALQLAKLRQSDWR